MNYLVVSKEIFESKTKKNKVFTELKAELLKHPQHLQSLQKEKSLLNLIAVNLRQINLNLLHFLPI